MADDRDEWLRQLRHRIALRREEEQRAREAAKVVTEQERERLRCYQERQQSAAARMSAELIQYIQQLDHVLLAALGVRPFSFDQMRPTSLPPSFKPEPHLNAPIPAMDRYEQVLTEARTLYKRTSNSHQQWLDELNVAHSAYDRQAAEQRKRIAEVNARLDQMRADFNAGRPAALRWFAFMVLERSKYPTGFPKTFQVAYRPENRDLVVEFELPPQGIVPEVRAYRYVKSRDAIEPLRRSQKEVKQRYTKLIARVALRTLHEIFTSTPRGLVEAIVFNGRVRTIDQVTGKEVRPHLLSVGAERAKFETLDLTNSSPVPCLKRLNALVSPNPYDLEAVEPFITFDPKRFDFSDDMDVASGLDSRRSLPKLSPTEFEHLIRELFVAMGAETWTALPPKDGGVEAVATSDNLFFGGVCLIQAKQSSGPVDLEAVSALAAAMTDHNATTGVLVATSWFDRAGELFARRNKITLINGAELKHLFKEHLDIDVVPGTAPPTQVRPSGNRQSGRPGPVA
ncbi:restriction endonuclease [Nonomuraea phyllanthi]|nr:restriction endonuclease [Nonomuraea phyllanthi]